MTFASPANAHQQDVAAQLAPFEKLRAPGVLLQCAAGALAAILLARATPGLVDIGRNQAGVYALFYLGVGTVLLVRGQSAHLDAERLLGRVPSLPTCRLAVVAVPLGMLMIAGFWLLFLPISFIAPDFVGAWAIANANRHPPQTVSGWTGQLVVAVVIAPVVEEALFRGFLMHRWALRWGARTGILLSSAIFAIGHVELLGHFAFGVVMCLLYARTRSLLVPILTHALNNFIASLGGLSAFVKPSRVAQPMTMASLRADWWIAVVLLALGGALLEAYRRAFWQGIDLKALLNGPPPYAR